MPGEPLPGDHHHDGAMEPTPSLPPQSPIEAERRGAGASGLVSGHPGWVLLCRLTQGPALGARAGRPGAGKEVAEKPGEGSRKVGLSPTEETLCLHVCDAERLSQPPVPRVLPPLPPNATASAKSVPTSQPSSSHILTFSGASASGDLP